MKKREGEPWMDAADYAHALQGLVINLLVSDVMRSVEFQHRVLEASVVYADADFAAIEGYGSRWMLHADHTYRDHPLSGIIADQVGRGIGAEIRLMGCDPDRACAAAREYGYTILDEASDKAHGTREAFIIDDEGYLWAPTISTTA